MGFKPLVSHSCYFILNDGMENVWIVVYFDHMLLIGNNGNLMDKVKTEMSKAFHVKTENTAAIFLGVHIDRSASYIILH